MAFLGLRLPSEVGRYLAAVDVPGERVDYGHAHVTITYLGDDVPLETVMRAAAVVASTAQMFSPIHCLTRSVSSFPAGDEGKHPIICPVESPELRRFKAALDRAFDLVGIDYNRKFPEYKPHTTLSYSPVPVADRAMPVLEWVAFEVVVWGGDERDGGVVVEAPFSPGLPERVAARFISGQAVA